MLIEDGDPVWLELSTPDVAAAGDFYTRLFGWDVRPLDDGRLLASAAGHPVASLVQHEVEEAQWRVFLKVPSISVAATAVATARGHILLSPTLLDDRGNRFALIEDPAGTVLGLMETENFDGFTIGTEHGQPTWFEVTGSDFRRLLNFYHQVLGWRYHYVDYRGIMTTVLNENTVFAANGPAGQATVGVVELDRSQEAGWRVYMAVDKLDGAAATAEAAGAQVDGRAGDGQLGRQLAVRDPQGARIILLETAV